MTKESRTVYKIETGDYLTTVDFSYKDLNYDQLRSIQKMLIGTAVQIEEMLAKQIKKEGLKPFFLSDFSGEVKAWPNQRERDREDYHEAFLGAIVAGVERCEIEVGEESTSSMWDSDLDDED